MSTAEDPPLLAVDGVHVRFGDIVALEGATVRLDPGRVTALVGVNGSGKSTLFRSIMGSVALERGTVRIAGLDPRTARRSGLLSHVPQSGEIDWSFPISVAEIVMMGRYGRLGVTRRPGARDRTAVADALARVGLAELAERQIGRLSGGQRQRVFIARALAQDAQLLLLDEPFAAIDARSESLLVELLQELAAAGRTILVSTHDLPAIPRLAEDVILLRQRVLFHGPTAEALRPERLAAALGLDADHRDGTGERGSDPGEEWVG